MSMHSMTETRLDWRQVLLAAIFAASILASGGCTTIAPMGVPVAVPFWTVASEESQSQKDARVARTAQLCPGFIKEVNPNPVVVNGYLAEKANSLGNVYAALLERGYTHFETGKLPPEPSQFERRRMYFANAYRVLSSNAIGEESLYQHFSIEKLSSPACKGWKTLARSYPEAVTAAIEKGLRRGYCIAVENVSVPKSQYEVGYKTTEPGKSDYSDHSYIFDRAAGKIFAESRFEGNRSEFEALRLGCRTMPVAVDKLLLPNRESPKASISIAPAPQVPISLPSGLTIESDLTVAAKTIPLSAEMQFSVTRGFADLEAGIYSSEPDGSTDAWGGYPQRLLIQTEGTTIDLRNLHLAYTYHLPQRVGSEIHVLGWVTRDWLSTNDIISSERRMWLLRFTLEGQLAHIHPLVLPVDTSGQPIVTRRDTSPYGRSVPTRFSLSNGRLKISFVSVEMDAPMKFSVRRESVFSTRIQGLGEQAN